MRSEYKIMVVAGEASGDNHAAKLVRALRAASPDSRFEFFGAGSRALRSAGMETIVNSDEMAIVGLPEIARALPMFLKAFAELKNAAVRRRPDAVILVDFPDFNLKLAKSLKRKGLTVVYYISPQLWAWRKYRLRTIRKSVDLLITILPFEKDWYAKQGVQHVEYVGSPLAREVRADLSREEFCGKYGLDSSRPIISLLPGSRHKEIVRILPVMLETAAKMKGEDERLQFVLALASIRNSTDADAVLRGSPAKIVRVIGDTYNALNASDAAAVTSGTATLETGLIGTPLAIVYKTSALNYTLLRPLISVEHFGLINLIAGRKVSKELIQKDFTPDSLADELFRLIDPGVNARVREQLREVADRLGHGGASARAADHILTLIDDKPGVRN